MYRFVVTFAFAILIALAGRAITQTPDEQTPSIEEPCSGLTGAPFGLCNSYCEAQDCDQHERASCQRLRDRLKRATGDPNATFPCDLPACGDAEFPECDGLCPSGTFCFAGSEFGGPENGGTDRDIRDCSCRAPCRDTFAPSCGGGCPAGLVCFGGAENGGSDFSGGEGGGDLGGGEGGSENGEPCSCQVPCFAAEAPACNGVCPGGGACIGFGGGDNGPISDCACIVGVP